MPAAYGDFHVPLQGMSFNATTSAYNLGTKVTPLVAQTTLTLFYLVGSGENGASYIWSRQSITASGQRLNISHNSGSPLISYTACCSSGINAPQWFTPGSGEVSYNNWWHVGVSWTGAVGSSSAAAITSGRNWAPMVARNLTYSVGGGTPDNRAAQSFIVGNSVAGDRTTNGIIAYVALWNRVLLTRELRIAQMNGPLAVPGGLVLCFANGRDYGPFGVPTVSATAPAVGRAPPGRGLLVPRRSLFPAPAAAAPSAAHRWFLMQ